MEAVSTTQARLCSAPTTPLNDGKRNGNPPGLSLWQLLCEDFHTHDRTFCEQGFWAISVHRFGNWRMDVRPRLLRAPLTLLYRSMFRCVEWFCGISLPYTVSVGRRVRIWHHSGMILHARSIGDDVQIRHTTTLGVARTGQNACIPVIEDRVDLGCHVCILGNVRIGAGAIIGAGSVVISDVPPDCLAVGVPASIRYRGSCEGEMTT